jgi:hypothetical protein
MNGHMKPNPHIQSPSLRPAPAVPVLEPEPEEEDLDDTPAPEVPAAGDSEDAEEDDGDAQPNTSRLELLAGEQRSVELEAEENATMEKLMVEEARDNLLHICAALFDTGVKANVIFFTRSVTAKGKKAKVMTFAIFSKTVMDAIGSSLGVVRSTDIICLQPEIDRDRIRIGGMHSWLFEENNLDPSMDEGSVRLDTSSFEGIIVGDTKYPAQDVLNLTPGVPLPWEQETPEQASSELQETPEKEEEHPHTESLRTLLLSLRDTFSMAHRDLKVFDEAPVNAGVSIMVTARVFKESEALFKKMAAKHGDLLSSD